MCMTYVHRIHGTGIFTSKNQLFMWVNNGSYGFINLCVYIYIFDYMYIYIYVQYIPLLISNRTDFLRQVMPGSPAQRAGMRPRFTAWSDRKKILGRLFSQLSNEKNI